jgi:hypothetical protein
MSMTSSVPTEKCWFHSLHASPNLTTRARAHNAAYRSADAEQEMKCARSLID